MTTRARYSRFWISVIIIDGPLTVDEEDYSDSALVRMQQRPGLGETTIKQIIDGVDVVYRDSRNLSTPVIRATALAMSIAGRLNDKDLLEEIENERKRATTASKDGL